MLEARHTDRRRGIQSIFLGSTLLSNPHMLSKPQSMSVNIPIPPPMDDSDPSFLEGLYSLATGDWQGMLDKVANANPKFPPLEVLPCANINAKEYAVCKNPGKLACSSCRLVSYCSKECQKAHWAAHKLDCKNPIRSNHWKPGWVREGREPSFLVQSNMSSAEEFINISQENLSIGSSLWGNVPAMNIVNLANNEKDPKKDLSLAFIASGDIRNIITTVNALGSDFSGQLRIFLNDLNPYVVSRNIVLLLILGAIPDEVIAADIALHFWYSVFLPAEYRLRVLSMVLTLLMKGDSAGPIVAPLGPHSTLTCIVSNEVRRLMIENAKPTMSLDQAQIEYDRVRRAPSRADYRDRMYIGLRPSHRLAFLEYRRTGIVLPFGALNAHCNVSNSSLFRDGVWLQTDYADPLESWDLDKVFAAGKAHGAQPEDVYGCLYFYLSDQLRAFARYLRQHRISFHVFSTEACALAQNITQGNFAEWGFPSTIRLDRIDVSNIMDPNYVGIQCVMDAWAPLLAKTDNAAVTGYFMNWAPFTKKGRVADAGPSVLRGLLDLMMRSNRLPLTENPILGVYLAMDDINAFYDNSKAFSKFWKDRGGADVKLQLRTVHKIIPHRLKTVIDAQPDALPEFADDDTWYRYTRLINVTWTERFVELCHRKT